jgi:hypothetical protein
MNVVVIDGSDASGGFLAAKGKRVGVVFALR